MDPTRLLTELLDAVAARDGWAIEDACERLAAHVKAGRILPDLPPKVADCMKAAA